MHLIDGLTLGMFHYVTWVFQGPEKGFVLENIHFGECSLHNVS